MMTYGEKRRENIKEKSKMKKIKKEIKIQNKPKVKKLSQIKPFHNDPHQFPFFFS